MKSSIFWDITPCSLVKVEEKVEQSSTLYLLHAVFWLGLLFEPEDGGDMFLRNVS
jgi:hypothetical protein